MKERLKVLVFSAAVGSIFGSIDYLAGLSYSIYELRGQGLYFLLSVFVMVQALYAAIGAGFGLISLMVAALFRFLRLASSPAERHLHFSGNIAGTMAGIFVVLLLEAYAKIYNNWGLFLDFVFFIPVGAAAGYGVKALWQNHLKDFLGGAMPGILVVAASFLLSSMFVSFWVLAGPLSMHGKLAMVILAAVLLLAGVYLGRAALLKKTTGMIAAYSFLAFLFMTLPLWTHKSAPKYEVLGKPKNPVNIILIVADACRADAVGIYAGKNQTPNIDRLAKEGVLFKNAYSQAPWTLPSMLSIMSSLYPSVVPYDQDFQSDSDPELFHQRLKKYGYQTQIMTANYMLAGKTGILKGIDRKLIIHNRFRLQRLLYCRVLFRTYYLCRRLLGLGQTLDHSALITAGAEAFLKKDGQPFFLWLHYMNPHEPYDPPARYLKQIQYDGFLRPPFYFNDPFHIPGDNAHPQELEVKLGYVFLANKDKQYIRELYLAQLRYLDEKMGDLVREIDKSGLGKNTILIFTSDHGEEFWEHGNVGHGANLHDESLHVPLIIWGAGLMPSVIEEQVNMIDLVPTLAELLGINPNPLWQGKSFYKALVSGPGKISSRATFAEGMQRPEEMKAISNRGYKLIVTTLTSQKFLYDLNHDPLEQKNILPEKPMLAKEMESRLSEWIAENHKLRAKLKPRKLSPERQKEFEEKLRTAGYVK